MSYIVQPMSNFHLDWILQSLQFQSASIHPVTIGITQHIRTEAVLPHIKLYTPLLIPLELHLYFLKHNDLFIIIQISKTAELIAITN
jgi:hypothetical protein